MWENSGSSGRQLLYSILSPSLFRERIGLSSVSAFVLLFSDVLACPISLLCNDGRAISLHALCISLKVYYLLGRECTSQYTMRSSIVAIILYSIVLHWQVAGQYINKTVTLINFFGNDCGSVSPSVS